MGAGRKGLSPSYVAQAIDASLRRLETDYVDVYLTQIRSAALQLSAAELAQLDAASA